MRWNDIRMDFRNARFEDGERKKLTPIDGAEPIA
jgi:hypothetical protein